MNDPDGASAFAQVLQRAFAEVSAAASDSRPAKAEGGSPHIDLSAIGRSFVEERPRLPWAEELGVQLPCDRQDIERAFRRLAFRAHPDRAGGSHAAFLRAKQVLDEALAWLRASTPPQAVAARFRAGSGSVPARVAVA